MIGQGRDMIAGSRWGADDVWGGVSISSSGFRCTTIIYMCKIWIKFTFVDLQGASLPKVCDLSNLGGTWLVLYY